MKRLFFAALLAVIVLPLFFSSCKKEKLLDDPNVKLVFSEDTVKFDTVFTTVGSATEVFTVTNTYDQPLLISTLRLATGDNSYFRLNVDGIPGRIFTDVEIPANDSIWIFVEVTLDPNNLNTPLIVTDSIIFIVNGSQQDVDLVSYGQNAHFYPTSGDVVSPCTPFFKLNSCNGCGHNLVWTNDTPHVIYGYAILDSGYTLTIEAGTRVHFHTNSGLVVLSTAQLIVNGTKEDPVTFQGDRLGEDYKDVPGQWDRIWFSTISSINLGPCPVTYSTGAGPKGNVFNHAIIKNGYVGIQSDSLDGSTIPAVVIDNTIIKNFASMAILGQGSFIQGNNSVFANCGEYLAALAYGGRYRFLHCTFVNYWNNGNRTTPSIYMQNSFGNTIRPLDEAYFGNCIIYGNIENEVGLDSVEAPGYFNFIFDHTLFRMNNETYGSGGSHYVDSYRNPEPLFRDIENNNYELDSTNDSNPALHTGSLSNISLNPLTLSTDIVGASRPLPSSQNPDLGAYENDDF